MSLLVTGGSGQLATALAQARPNGTRVVGRPEFDFDRPETIGQMLRNHRPEMVVNAAAWTAVDAAEASPEAADRANHTGPASLALHCRAMGIPLVHISTDYVFDGCKGTPYVETDTVNPTQVYGRTKLAGERAVMAAHPEAAVLRTAWVYGRTGRNFVYTMLGAARRTTSLRVVADQLGCPTNADDLAAAVLAICDRLAAGAPGLAGIMHLAGQGATSWHGFASAIFAEAGRHGWPVPDLQAIATADWPTPARRPADTRLDCSRAASLGVRLPPWQDSLRHAIAAICAAAPHINASLADASRREAGPQNSAKHTLRVD